MKPLVLRMEAFGSYKEKAEIDYRKFKNGLYLITGDTGAGKTTIFDGISVALFGQPSGRGGSGNDKGNAGSFRTFEMMHSDYVGKDVPATVELIFAQGGKEYRVKRTLSFTKERKTGLYKTSKTSCEFYEPGKDVLTGDTKVNNRIKEILGIDADQFRKIIMLAQGEFKKFLQANAEEKNQILGELFDNTPYVYYKNLLNETRKALEDQRWNAYQTRVRAMEDFQLPEGLTEEEATRFLPEHTELLTALAELIREEEEKKAIAQEEKNQGYQRHAHLIGQKEKAKADNEKLAELKGKKEHLLTLQEQSDEMEILRAKVVRVENAVREVMPKEKSVEVAEKAKDGCVTDIEGLTLSCETAAENRKNAEQTVQEDASLKEEIQTLETEQEKIRSSKEDYLKLERAKETEKAASRLKVEVSENLTKIKEKKADREKHLADLKKALEDLKGIDAEVVEAKGELAKTKEALEKATGRKGLTSKMEDITLKIRKEKNAKDTFRRLSETTDELFKDYSNCYQAFLQGQASILAVELENTLAEKGEAVCPVCHSHFIKGQEHTFAEKTEAVPTEEVVNSKKEKWDEVEKQRQDAQRNLGLLQQDLKHAKEDAVDLAITLDPDCSDWEKLSTPGYLDGLVERLTTVKNDAQDVYRAAERKQDYRDNTLQPDFNATEKLIQNLGERITYETDALNNHEKAISKAKGTIETLGATLPFADWKSAEKRLDELQKLIGPKKNAVEGNQKALEKAREEEARVTGALKQKQEDLPGLERNFESAKTEFKNSLSDNDFADSEEYRQLLQDMMQENPKLTGWIDGKNALLNRYHNDLQNTKNRIRELEEATEGLVPVDLAVMDQKLYEASEAFKVKDQEYAAIYNLLENHKKTEAAVTGSSEELMKTEKAWRRLDTLASLAVGENAVGGRLSFDRYVMGSVFREVLNSADERLKIITGGKYTLRHKMEAKNKNAIAGLDINVYDSTTDKERESGSLSGGESFLVSLSLALGLSDVVQNHAGGIQLDALFVDEGFGSLDGSILDKAIEVLNNLTEGNRMVGIISHVEKLESSIPQKLIIRNPGTGSTIKLEM